MADFMHHVTLSSDSPLAMCGRFVQICTDNWQRVTCPDCLAHRPKFVKGDRVHWTQTRMGRRTLTMARYEGVVEKIERGEIALVRTSAKSKVRQVHVSRLRQAEEPSQITEFIEAVRDATQTKR